jgi:hypothetical protein
MLRRSRPHQELAQKTSVPRQTLLLGLFSGHFFDNNPQALGFLKKHFQVFALLTLPKPYKKEYGIEVDSAFVAAYAVSHYDNKRPIPLTGTWEKGSNPDALARAVVKAYEDLNPNPYSGLDIKVFYLRGGWRPLPELPRLDMAVEVDTDRAPVRVGSRGLQPEGDWAGAWTRFYATLPAVDYSVAEGANADIIQAYGAVPNVLIRGIGRSQELLEALGFEASVTPHDRERVERMAWRYRRERLPLRELHPVEYLAWYDDGPVTAEADVTIPGAGPEEEDVEVHKRDTFHLRVRWERSSEVAKTENKTGTRNGKKVSFTERTYVDRGYLVFRLTPTDGRPAFTVRETEPKQVEAFIQAFPLPEVPTVADLPHFDAWVARLERLCDEVEARCGLRLYEQQFDDVARLAMQGRVALLYEQGGGKTTCLAHWATVRGYRRVIVVTPAAVVGQIIEDLRKWGFEATRLSHREISRIQAEKRAKRTFYRRRRDARARLEAVRRRLSADDLYPDEQDRLEREANGLEAVLTAYEKRDNLLRQLARKRRHLHNLLDIAAKGKASAEAIQKEIEAVEAEVAGLEEELAACPHPLTVRYVRKGGYLVPEPGEPQDGTTRFWVCSYQDLGLGDGVYDTWEHEHYDADGNLEGVSRQNGAKCAWPGCRVRRAQVVTHCPKCGHPWQGSRGSDRGGARHCRKCGYIAWSQGALGVRPRLIHRLLPGDSIQGLAEQYGVSVDQIRAANSRLAGRKVKVGTPVVIPEKVVQAKRHCPMGYRIKRLFNCAILDEAQDAKSKGTLTGETTRALHTKGRGLATGTLIAGYVTDLFWNVGWLLGLGSPLWPFPWRGGSARFLEQFGTYRWITREFADTLQTGQRRLIPSVSNLGRLWRLLSAFSLRREKAELLQDLPPKHVHVHWVDLDPEHEKVYTEVEGWAAEEIAQAVHAGKRDQVAMGRIGRALWKSRYCASTATRNGWPYFADVTVGGATQEETDETPSEDGNGPGSELPPSEQGLAGPPAKVRKALEIIREVRDRGEKALVFTSLDGLYRDMAEALTGAGIGFYGLKETGQSTARRLAVVRRFEADPGATVLLAGTKMLNRGITAVGANHVLILNLEWAPEATVQAEDRVHRPGQEREVHVHYILSAGTMEEEMMDLVQQKREAQVAVLDRRTRNRTVRQILQDALPFKMRLARDLLANHARRKARRCTRRVSTPSAEVERRPAESPARPVRRAEVAQPDLWAVLRAQHGPQQPRRRRRKTSPPPEQAILPGFASFVGGAAP